jgi:hypothetical protein
VFEGFHRVDSKSQQIQLFPEIPFHVQSRSSIPGLIRAVLCAILAATCVRAATVESFFFRIFRSLEKHDSSLMGEIGPLTP